MKISLAWIKEYLTTDLPTETISALLTASGLEVEGVETFEPVKGGMKGLVIGEVLTCVKHPNADKLSLTTVEVGESAPLQIVCGAPNVEAGQKVVVALTGTIVHPVIGDPFEIKKSKIRGEVSEGMICAEDEIGLGTSHAGIIILPADVKVGSPAKDFFGIKSDEILEIGLTPNRADAASHYGVARDLAAVIRCHYPSVNVTLSLPDVKAFKAGTDTSLQIELQNPESCPRYSGLVIKNVEVKESPDWLKERLRSIDVAPINNIVDITNFVLHELGQPLHAFDADKIKGNKVVVRNANTGEKFISLDKVERKLFPTDLMICNAEEPMCIGGVFGGAESGINSATKNVFLESAYFNPVSIRKTSKLHGLKTDASFRYERGTDPEITVYALTRAALMIQELAGGEIASPVMDVYPQTLQPVQVNLNYKYVDQFSGLVIDRAVIKSILTDLGIKILSENIEGLSLEIPLFKVDVTRPVDLVEEILRVYSYDRIPVPAKINSSLPAVETFNIEGLQNKIANYLADNGFNEMLSNSLTQLDYAKEAGWNENAAVKILNPLSADLSIMRQSMLMSGMEVIQYNRNRKQADLKLFEFGKVYTAYNESFQEKYRWSVFMTGEKQEVNWKQDNRSTDFYLLKAYVENILTLCGISGNKVKVETEVTDDFAYGMTVYYGKVLLAKAGAVHSTILRKFDGNQPVFYAEINWSNVLKHASQQPIRYKEISKFPHVKRDLSMMIPKEVTYARLKEISFRTETKLLTEVRLFDIYEGEKIESGKKSIALSFILLDETQTLTDKQIDKTMERLMQAFEKEVGAVIRRG